MKKETYVQKEFCVHKHHLYNLGTYFCELNKDLDCENCKFREPRETEVTLTSDSAEIITNNI